MKFSILLTAATLFTSSLAFGQCNTVMGGCTTEETVNVAPHMRADNNKPVANTKAATAPAPANKNIKNANASNAQAAKSTTKKM